MNYQLIEDLPSIQDECLIIGLCSEVFDLERINPKYAELIKQLYSKLDQFKDSIWQGEVDGSSLMVIHCGKQDEFNSECLKEILKELCAIVIKQKVKNLVLSLPAIRDHDANWQLTQTVLHIDSCFYDLPDFKTQADKTFHLKTIKFLLPDAHQKALEEGIAIAQGIHLTRRLADLPANICTPSFLAQQAQKLAVEHQLSVNILGPEEIAALGMNAFLAVAKGSQEPPRFIELQYHAGGNTAPFVIIGKGITFDSGGLSLKPANCMDEMKYDMAGAANVLGILKTCALLKLPINLIGLIPSTENMPGGKAVKPGDIIHSLSGQTIEILNTDAEGRLALADALTYAERFNPAWVIDIATLTGAVIVGLGYIYTGLITPDEDLAQKILAASQMTGDKTWRLPLDEDYQEALESPLADMINASCSDRSAGSIIAACFLSRFSNAYPWAHLDIAGTAWVPGKKRHATGRPLPLLIELLKNESNSH